MEALWSRFLPAVKQAGEWIARGYVGKPSFAQIDIGFLAPPEAGNRYRNPKLGGGAAFDITVYAYEIARFLLGREESLAASAVWGPTGVDVTDHVVLHFPEMCASLTTSFDAALEEKAVIYGNRGRIVLPHPHYASEAFFYPQDGGAMISFRDTETKNGFLYEEPNFLLTDEVQVPTNYFSIIKVIADGNHKLGTIAGILGLETSALTPYLKTLSELGFIEKQVPVTEKNAEKTRKGLYFISDNLLRFWFRYVYPYKGELELDNIQISLDELNKDFREKFVAFAYEDICKEIFAKLCSDKKIDFTPSKIGSYWLNDYGGNTQIDVMAVDTVNKRLFAGECKYRNQPIDADVYFELAKKVENSSEIQSVFKGYDVIYGVFSKSGFTNRILDISSTNPNLFLINETTIK